MRGPCDVKWLARTHVYTHIHTQTHSSSLAGLCVALEITQHTHWHLLSLSRAHSIFLLHTTAATGTYLSLAQMFFQGPLFEAVNHMSRNAPNVKSLWCSGRVGVLKFVCVHPCMCVEGPSR